MSRLFTSFESGRGVITSDPGLTSQAIVNSDRAREPALLSPIIGGSYPGQCTLLDNPFGRVRSFLVVSIQRGFYAQETTSLAMVVPFMFSTGHKR